MHRTIVLGVLLIATMITVVSAQSPMDAYSRKGKGEIYGFGQYLASGGDTTFGNVVSLKFNSGFGGGAGFGFNVIDYLNINTEIGVSGFDIEGNALGLSASGNTTVLHWNVNIDFNILRTRLTPLITGGIGLMRVSGDVQGVDFDETDLSYGVGGGMRWDFTNHWFVKAVYRANWTNLKDSDNATLFHSVLIGVGYAF